MQAADRERCPSENTVVELLEAGLAPERRAVLGAHVDRCSTCRELVVVMARSQMATTGLGGRMRFARASEGGGAAVLAPGDQVGRYRIEELLGQGGMGVVYAARDPELDRRVAVKLIRPELAAYSDVIAARLAGEARAMARVAHPNVIAVHDVGSEGGQVFVAMELVGGSTLREWLAAPRGWREVLEAFRAAGEGLAAAHAAGLVHRDFKPDNVLIDAGGRVRVTDFGLARALGREPHDASDASDARSALLTHSGAALGTPAYMAPEQHAQLATDERSDQFSFCVALWEALYRERPFAGETVLELADAVVAGRMRPPPRQPRLPGWLRRALLRGLSLRPEDRFPTMRALLDALRPRRPRARLVAIAAGLVGAGALAVAAAGSTRDPGAHAACAGDGEIAAVWNQARRGELRAALVKAGGGTAPAEVRWQLVDRSLDRYAQSWRRMRADACAAGARGDQSAELVDLRTHCLGARLADLDQVLGLLDTSDPVIAENAIASIAALPPVERCSAVEVVEARVPVPSDPAQRREVEALRREVLSADLLRLAGRYAESRALLESLRARAEAVGYRPVLADVLYFLGELEVSTGSASQGEATLRRAAHTAEAGRYDELAADAWILLIETASQATGEIDRAAEYAEHARAALDRLGRHTRLEGQYEQHMGILDWVRSRPDDALAHFAAARRIFEQLGDAEMVLGADEGTALIYEEQGKLEEALRINRSVLAGRERRFGPDHPDTALSYNAVASALTHLGRHDEALVNMNKVLAIRQRANGPEHFETAQARHNIGELLRNLGRFDESLEQHRRSLAVFEREFGGEHQHVAVSLEHIGGVYLDMGRTGEALPLLGRALAIFERALGEENLETVRARINLADGLRQAGRPREALGHDRRALGVMSAGMGTANLYAAHAELGAGLDLVGLGRLADARAPLERALVTLEQIGGDPVALGKARFALARALWSERGSRARARKLAADAVSALTGAAGENLRLRREATTWLRARSD